jgi:hypothetical protein
LEELHHALIRAAGRTRTTRQAFVRHSLWRRARTQP